MMDFWNSRKAQDDDRDSQQDDAEPTFLQKLTDFAKDEAKDYAIGSVVEHLTGGWITYESEDPDEEDPRQRGRDKDEGTFEERLQRSLAALQTPAAQAAQHAPVAARAPVSESPAAPAPMPVPAPMPAARPAPHRAQGFGRKGL